MSCQFIDGPAAGLMLDLRRAPHFLRLVHNDRLLRWDALDQPGDVPTMEETIYVYVMQAGTWGWVHVRANKRGASGRYEHGVYRHLPLALVGGSDAPDGEEPTVYFANRDRWIEWITRQGDDLAELHGCDPWPGSALRRAADAEAQRRAETERV